MTNEVPATPATPVAPESSIRTVVVPLSKPLWKSWTLIFNIISGIILILNQISPFANVLFSDPKTAKNVSDLIAALLVVLNILLRFKTNSSLKFGFKIVRT